MKNNHNVEVYDNGHGNRIAFDFQAIRRVLTIEQAKALKESLEYGLTKAQDNGCTCGTFSSRKFCPVHGYKE